MIARSPRGPVIASALLMAVALVACTASGDEPTAATPDDVAAGLLPAVVLEGETPAPYTLQERMERYRPWFKKRTRPAKQF